MQDVVRVWDAESGQQLFELSGHRRSVLGAAFNPDGTQILTWGADGTARLWNAADGTERALLKDTKPRWSTRRSVRRPADRHRLARRNGADLGDGQRQWARGAGRPQAGSDRRRIQSRRQPDRDRLGGFDRTHLGRADGTTGHDTRRAPRPDPVDRLLARRQDAADRLAGHDRASVAGRRQRCDPPASGNRSGCAGRRASVRRQARHPRDRTRRREHSRRGERQAGRVPRGQERFRSPTRRTARTSQPERPTAW